MCLLLQAIKFNSYNTQKQGDKKLISLKITIRILSCEALKIKVHIQSSEALKLKVCAQSNDVLKTSKYSCLFTLYAIIIDFATINILRLHS